MLKQECRSADASITLSFGAGSLFSPSPFVIYKILAHGARWWLNDVVCPRCRGWLLHYRALQDRPPCSSAPSPRPRASALQPAPAPKSLAAGAVVQQEPDCQVRVLTSLIHSKVCLCGPDSYLSAPSLSVPSNNVSVTVPSSQGC